ncbi:MAG: transglycosylase SLT domain-containing protein [Candidatus Eisenbacteria bacterium]|nr:transglycosylase SLT domain-containing protein [Candidatus Eisenbacteria bacterium]
MANHFQPGIRGVILAALLGLSWAPGPGARAADDSTYLGPDVPVLTPADSLAFMVDVPGEMNRASAELSRCHRLLKNGRMIEAQHAAERLLASLHDLRQRVPLSYARNQQLVKLIQQAGGVRLRCVRQHLTLRPEMREAGSDAGEGSDAPDTDGATSSAPRPGEADPAGSRQAGTPTHTGHAASLGPSLLAALPPSPADSLIQGREAQQILPESNDRVQKWIDFFTGRGHSTFQTWLTRSGEYVDMMLPVLERNGLPTDLIHVVFVESGFNPKALSSSAASGPWQFIKSTAQIFGLNVNQKVDERRDPARSTEAAAQYLKHLYSLFHDWPLALAAYNSGEGTVLRALSSQNSYDYWSLRLPRQTQDYVPAFMAALTIAKDPGSYGFKGTPMGTPLSFDEIHVPGGVNLKVLAHLSRAPIEVLGKLNPAYLRKTASPKDGGTLVRVPKGTGREVLAKLRARDYPAALAKAEPVVLSHRIHKGETLSAVARRYGVTVKELARANRIRDLGSRLRPGGVLRVPGREESVPMVPAGPYPPAPAGSAPAPGASVGVPSPALAAVQAGPPVPRFMAASMAGPVAPEPRPATARAALAGPPLPSGAAKPAPPLGPARPALGRTCTVKKGETLYALASRFGCRVSDLVEWNGLEEGESIRPGQTLVVAQPEVNE